MPVLRLGLVFAVLGCAYVAWASWAAGYPPEVALVRGMIAFMAFSLVAYIGELVIATAPPARKAATPAAERGAPAVESDATPRLEADVEDGGDSLARAA